MLYQPVGHSAAEHSCDSSHITTVGRGETRGAGCLVVVVEVAMVAWAHIRLRFRLALIALCDKWRRQCVEIITTQMVAVNKHGMRTMAPQMSAFKRCISFKCTSLCAISQSDHFFAKQTH